MQAYPPHSAPGLRGANLDRASEKRKDADWIHSLYAEADWLPVWRYRSAISDGRPQFLKLDELAQVPQQPIFLGLRFNDGRAVFCFDASTDDSLAQRLQFADLRGSVPILSSDDAALLGYARAMIYWQRQHRHCGRCGARTQAQSAGHVLYCNDCEVEHYPRSDPSMLCLVTDPQDRALLGRQPQWPRSLYSVLAGFAEPGETIEDCVAREIWEEARVKVTGTRYIASQPWPFPASVLLGFIASSAGETPQTSQDELDAADWFSRADIAEGIRSGQLHVPPPFTLSHHLIRTWFDAGSDMPLAGYFSSEA
jgi:NAD+ diphosphatase